MSALNAKQKTDLEIYRAFEDYSKERRYFFDCIDFAASPLNERAIFWMNTGLSDLMEKIKKIEGGD